MYTTLIIEDSLAEQELLAKMLNKNFPEIQIAGISSRSDEGLKKINLTKPQLVFLDIELQPYNGFEMLSKIDKIDFEIIFIASCQENAIKALQFSAVDYLLKPFSYNDLEKAIKKFKGRIAFSNYFKSLEVLRENLNSNALSKKKISLPVLKGYEYVEIKEIIRCKAEDHYTWFYFLSGESRLITKNLKEFECLLTGNNFYRVHNSHLINLSHVKKYVKGKGGYVVMIDGTAVDVSVKYRDAFLFQINQ